MERNEGLELALKLNPRMKRSASVRDDFHLAKLNPVSKIEYFQ